MEPEGSSPPYCPYRSSSSMPPHLFFVDDVPKDMPPSPSALFHKNFLCLAIGCISLNPQAGGSPVVE